MVIENSIRITGYVFIKQEQDSDAKPDGSGEMFSMSSSDRE
jgi:hypothetical protein